MDKKKKMIIIYASAAALLAAVFFAVYFITRRDDSGAFKMPVYFFNVSAGTLEAEEQSPGLAEPQVLIDKAVQAFFGSPRSASLSRPWPEAEGFLTGYKMNGNILEATFSGLYGELTPVDEALFRAAFVKTMTGLPTVDYIRILPEGVETTEGTGYLSPEDYEINPVILPNRVSRLQFTLYFVNDTMDGLVKRVHTSDQVDMDQKEMYIVNQIIAQQREEGFYPAIPPETKVTIELDDSSSTCYVNLSSEVMRFNGNPALAKLMLYSIVNSLTANLVNVRNVQFQIDSQIVEQFYGVTGFNQAFVRDETLVVE